MILYADTELDSDIQYIKGIISQYKHSYKDIGENFLELNKTISSRINFISSQFKNILGNSYQ